MWYKDAIYDLAAAPPVGKPYVSYIHQDGHDWVEEHAYPCPPSSPYYQLGCHHWIQACETAETNSPNINIYSTFIHDFMLLEDIYWHQEYNERVHYAKYIDVDVICPVEDGFLVANVVQFRIQLSYL